MADAVNQKSYMASATTPTMLASLRESKERLEATIPDLEKWVQGGLADKRQLDDARKALADVTLILSTVDKGPKQR